MPKHMLLYMYGGDTVKQIGITELHKTLYSTLNNMKNGEKLEVLKSNKVVAVITKKGE